MTNPSTGVAAAADTTFPSQIGLAIWSQVEKTNPKFTTPIPNTSFTSIAPVYMIKRATEVLGPIGIGWGYVIVEEGFVDGGPLGFGSDGEPLGPQRVHILRLKFWYVWQGQRGEFEHFGQTPFVGLNSDRTRVVTDSDVKKKSLTDALTKCLSLVGICSDVHMGLHDDSQYVSSLICEFGSSAEPVRLQPLAASPSVASSASPADAPSSSVAASPPAVSNTSSPAAPKRRQRSSDNPPAAADSTSSAANAGHQSGLDLGASGTSAPQPTSTGAPASDINLWLQRIKSLGGDAIKVSRSTVQAIFQGDDLARVQSALDQRERELTKAT